MTELSTSHNNWQALIDAVDGLAFDGAQSYQLQITGGDRNSSAPLCSLCHDLGLLQVSGSDAATFLQGQLTADIDSMAAGDTCWAAHCNAKGRVVANYFLHRVDPQTFLLILPVDQQQIAQKALQKYAVFSKVDVENLNDHFFALGELAPFEGQLPKALHQVSINSQARLLVYRWEDVAGADWPGIFNKQLVGGSADWQQQLIALGYTLVVPATSGEFIPQMLNMDLLDGISFSKGCYTGQEVIARLKYRGEVKRRGFRFRGALDGQSPPSPGSALYDEANKKIGEIATVCSIDNEIQGLAIFKLQNDQPPARAWLENGASQAAKNPLEIIPGLPPYAIPNN